MRRPSARSQQLLDVASELLDAEGPHALSLRRVAEAAGTSTQAVYTEFGGKAGLADALFRLGYRRLADRLGGVELPEGLVERVVALGRAYRAVAHERPAHYEIMTGRPIAEYRPPSDSLAIAAATIEPLRDAIDRVVTAGLADGDPASLARDLWAAGHGYVSLELHGLIDVDDLAFDGYLRRQIRTWPRTP